MLRGQTSIAQKVYQAIPSAAGQYASAMDVAGQVKKATGAGIDIHVLRGCLASLKRSGLVREVTPGSFRQVGVREKVEMKTEGATAEVMAATEKTQVSNDPMDMLGDLSGRLRGLMASLGRLADDIDGAAILIGERAGQSAAELAKVKQIATLLKELG
ncbi:hypothetical protein [Bordetella avium]|uniref:hypothetical protein n=1 Tax=Bordetella avium TaxID=521 RepID=UPI0011C4564A|nr:hypothetical protein [Bordetella avium]